MSVCLRLWDQSICKVTFIFSIQRTFLMRSGSNLSHYNAKIGKFEVLERSRLCGQLKFTEWNSKVGCTQLFWYYSFYSRHSFLIYVLLGNYQLVPAHSVSFRVLQIGQNHFSSHIFINFCLIPQSFALIAMCDVEFSGMNEILLTLSWRIFFLRLEFALCWVNKDKKFDGLKKLLSWL